MSEAGPAPVGAAPVASVVVVVPAHDEELLLGRCLRSVRASVEHLALTHPEVATRMVVVLDDCTDASAAVAAAHPVEVVSTSVRCVGAARAYGVRHALARRAPSEGHPQPVDEAVSWLACTDADSVVPLDWLSAQVRAADAGADLVLGTARPDPVDLDPGVLLAWETAHDRAALVATPVHGANLGVRARAYVAAGGFPHLTEHEDVALVRALSARGAAVATGPTVLTSGRRTGRTPGGFAAFLRALPAGREVLADPAPG